MTGCSSYSVRVEYSSHTHSTVPNFQINDEIILWLAYNVPRTPSAKTDFHSGTSFPYCISLYHQYSYGLGTFLQLDCVTLTPISSTARNPLWELYATETNLLKGLILTIILSNEETLLKIVSQDPVHSTATSIPPSATDWES